VLKALVLDTLVMTVNAVTVEAQATANQLPDMDYNGNLLVVVDDKARASEASKTVPATIDKGTSVSCSETLEGKSGWWREGKVLIFIYYRHRAAHCTLTPNRNRQLGLRSSRRQGRHFAYLPFPEHEVLAPLQRRKHRSY
jgi:hypothetical protein